MAKAITDAWLDGTLDKIALAVDMDVCSSEPANYAAIAGASLANHTMAGGDYTKAAGDTSGRKVTVAEQASVSISSTGTATHVVLSLPSTDFFVTTCTSQALTSGGTVTIPAFDVEIGDPT